MMRFRFGAVLLLVLPAFGAVAGPVVHTQSLLYEGQPSGPKIVTTPALIYAGEMTGSPIVSTPEMIYLGAAGGPIVVGSAEMLYIGSGSPPIVIGSASMIYLGAQAPTTNSTPEALTIFDVPNGPRQSKYFRLDNASVDISKPFSLRYEGLPDKRGYGGLFYLGGEQPQLAGWFYTSPSVPSGVYERSGLPPRTGPWKACIGFPPRISGNDRDISRYDDCLDFVAAGPDSLNAHPVFEVPPGPLKARRELIFRYSGMPPCNCRMNMYDQAGRSVASHGTSRLESGTWKIQFAEPGTYEMRLTYHGDAVRASLKLEIEP